MSGQFLSEAGVYLADVGLQLCPFGQGQCHALFSRYPLILILKVMTYVKQGVILVVFDHRPQIPLAQVEHAVSNASLRSG